MVTLVDSFHNINIMNISYIKLLFNYNRIVNRGPFQSTKKQQ